MQAQADRAATPVQLRPHTLVASIAAKSTEEAIAAIGRLPAEVGLAEIRLDALWPSVPDADRATDDLLALSDAARLPLLATLRPKRQGGKFDGPEQVRLGLLQTALRAGFAFADLEMDGLDASGRMAQLRQDGGVVASSHWPDTPCRSDGLNALLAMQDLGAAYDKLAFTAGAFPDLLRAFELTRTHAERGGRPSVSTLEHGGAATRALLPLVGNRATYGAAPGLPPAAPGQPTITDLVATWRHWGLGPNDLDVAAAKPGPWLAVLGAPVEHSLSPRLHNAALRAGGRRERFGALEVPASASALRLFLHVAPRLGMVGASVTAPHKLDAARASQGDASVQRTGAANCLRWQGEAVQSTNTDFSALKRLLGPHVSQGDAALVLGAGGAARAAIAALQDLGAKVTFTSRDAARADAVAKQTGAAWLPWEQRALAKPRLVVQATPLGNLASDPSPLAVGAGVRVAVELAYAAGQTRFEREAAAAGAKVIAGREALLA
ncbi:MAG: 3-dehydroquinate dehydratase / shikimate dehydrogenase, partial [Thermoplasmata archaeon]|nr:3-dehydroquinate dehydratase / shikimate dehydrogenase [Thermoplasmata archaeon]